MVTVCFGRGGISEGREVFLAGWESGACGFAYRFLHCSVFSFRARAMRRIWLV